MSFLRFSYKYYQSFASEAIKEFCSSKIQTQIWMGNFGNPLALCSSFSVKT